MGSVMRYMAAVSTEMNWAKPASGWQLGPKRKWLALQTLSHALASNVVGVHQVLEFWHMLVRTVTTICPFAFDNTQQASPRNILLVHHARVRTRNLGFNLHIGGDLRILHKSHHVLGIGVGLCVLGKPDAHSWGEKVCWGRTQSCGQLRVCRTQSSATLACELWQETSCNVSRLSQAFLSGICSFILAFLLSWPGHFIMNLGKAYSFYRQRVLTIRINLERFGGVPENRRSHFICSQSFIRFDLANVRKQIAQHLTTALKT